MTRHPVSSFAAEISDSGISSVSPVGDRSSWSRNFCAPSSRTAHQVIENPILLSLARLSLTKPVTKTVWCNDVEHLPGNSVVLFHTKLREFLVEPVGLEFSE